ncbi:C4-dicarboxylate ABC transporter substrate-binding protein [Brevibacterium litoralis]|uniref:C4-dicarboxylate ABC transporter substrate-binding protein n=1 Tax=Brevibacterium litoralis TaxID=3138935 RepID=UPI0032EECC9B
MHIPRTFRPAGLVAGAAVCTLALSACAGGAGGGDTASGEGFEYGIPQEELNEIIADLDPVEITYQAGAQSPNSVSAATAIEFKDYIETRSNGQITVDLVYGQAIAGYAEIDDALADGRVDLSYALPIYNPTEYPAFDALATATAGMPNSPVVGEAVGNAAVVDLAWGSEQLLAEYEEKGLSPITPMISTGSYYTVCSSGGTTLDDFNGRQVRIASTAHAQQATNLGASPVSMEYVEVFEALQRGTVDCTLAQLLPSEETGVLEVAPHVGYTTQENSLSGRSAGANLAGSGYQALPLAYQQIIFDSAVGGWATSNQVNAEGNYKGVAMALDNGGEVVPIDPETDEQIGATNDELLAAVEESGVIDAGVVDRTAESIQHWTDVAAELGMPEDGAVEDINDWYELGSVDFMPMAERLYEESIAPHRPGA